MTPAERKQRLRRQAAALPKLDEPALVEAFLALPKVEQADTVMLFYGVGRELDTTPLLEALLAQGKRVCYPVCLSERQMQARAVSSAKAKSKLAPGARPVISVPSTTTGWSMQAATPASVSAPSIPG